MRFFFCVGSGLVLSLTATVFGQSPRQPPPFGDYATHVGATAITPDGIGEQKEPRSRTPSIARPAPSAADRKAFAVFLKQPNTGLMRLVPDIQKKVTSVANLKAPPVSGFSYSFVKKAYSTFRDADILLWRDQLMVGGYGLITTLGDEPLETITIAHPSAAYLSSNQPPFDQVEKVKRIGFDVDGKHYSREAAIELNQTYLLRSIIRKKSDALVALRIVRKESNGSVTIAWKRLEK
jgi:hypothetical protein